MTSREERLQQRLRGAQTHQVRNVDFGLAFPTAAPATPSVNENEDHDTSLQTRSSSVKVNQSSQPKTPVPSTKRGADDNTAGQSSLKRPRTETPTSSTRSTRSQGNQRRDIYEIEEEEPEPRSTRSNGPITPPPVAAEVTTTAVATTTVTETTRTPNTKRKRDRPAEVIEEVSESPRGAPGSGQRRSVEQNRTGTRDQAISQESPTLVPRVHTGSPRPQSGKRRRGRPSGTVLSRASPELGLEATPRPQRPRATTEEIDELSPEQTERLRASSSRLRKLPDADEEVEEAEEIDDATAAVKLLKTKRHTPRRYQEEDELAHETSPESTKSTDKGSASTAASQSKQLNQRGKKPLGEPSSNASPAVQSQPRSKRQARLPTSVAPSSQSQPTQSSAVPKQAKPKAQRNEKAENPKKRRNRESVPVTVHRLTKPTVYSEDADDADILNSNIPHAKRSGVNSADVLAQVTEEVIESALNNLESGGQQAQASSLRREYNTRMDAIENFQEALRSRFMDLSIGLDDIYALRKRIRDAQREKVELREDIMRIRKEREDIALRMDDVRLKHEEGTKTAEKREDLNTSVHDIELAVERGRANNEDDDGDMVGLELLLKKVAGKASSASHEGGILKQIKDFNAFLERAALALENRG